MTDVQFEENIRLILSGSRDGLRAVYDEYLQAVYAVAYSVVRHRQDAEDVTADVFLKLWDKAGTYRFGSSHKTWLFTIARNTALDALKKARHTVPMEVPEPEDKCAGQEPEETVCLRVPLQNALQSLKPDEQQIVALHVLGGVPFQSMSVILKKPLGTVAWTYRNAMQKLRRCNYE